MTKDILEENEAVVVQMAEVYLDNLELELGRKYRNSDYEINVGLSDSQYMELREKNVLSNAEFQDVYNEFVELKPTEHLQKAMAAFTASGGSVEIEPQYDGETERLRVPIQFIIKDRTLDKIEGLSAVEDIVLRINAMIQIETVLSNSDSDTPPSF